jgi:hypothetical protein
MVRRALETEHELPQSDRRWVLFSSVWVASWVVAIAFVIGGHEPGADRHAYPLLAALAVFAAAVVHHLRPIVRASTVAVLGLWVVWAGLLAHERVGVWSDDLTLWRHEVITAPASARVHHNLAAELVAHARYGSARRHLRSALALEADYWPSELGLAAIDCIRGRSLSAAGHLAEAATIGAPLDEVANVQATCARRASAK